MSATKQSWWGNGIWDFSSQNTHQHTEASTFSMVLNFLHFEYCVIYLCSHNLITSHAIFLSGLYNGAGDHFSHEVNSLIVGGPSGLDWHFNNGTNQTVVWDEDDYYSTIAFTDKVIDIVEEHDTSQVRYILKFFQ